MLTQADQENIVYGYFPAWIDNYVVWVNSLCNVVADLFTQHCVYNIFKQCRPSFIDTTFYRLFHQEKLDDNHGPTLHR